MEIIVVPKQSQPNVQLSETGETIMLGIMAASVVGFFYLAKKMLDSDPFGEPKPPKKRFFK